MLLLWFAGRVTTSNLVPTIILATGVALLGQVLMLALPSALLAAFLMALWMPFPVESSDTPINRGFTLLIFWPWLVILFGWLTPYSNLGRILGAVGIGVVLGYVLNIAWLAAIVGLVTVFMIPGADRRLGRVPGKAGTMVRMLLPLLCLLIGAWFGATSTSVQNEPLSAFSLLDSFGFADQVQPTNPKEPRHGLGPSLPPISLVMLTCSIFGIWRNRQADRPNACPVALSGFAFCLLIWSLQATGMHDQFREMFLKVMIQERVDRRVLNWLSIDLMGVVLTYLLGALGLAQLLRGINLRFHSALAIAVALIALSWKFPVSDIVHVDTLSASTSTIVYLIAGICLVYAGLGGVQRFIRSGARTMVDKCVVMTILAVALLAEHLFVAF